LLFSGTCRFCRWAARVVARLDRREVLALLPLDDEETGRLLASVPEKEHTRSWWIVLGSGQPIGGDRGGGVQLLRHIPATRPIGRMLGCLGLSPLIDTLDKVVAKGRRYLSRLVPDGPVPRRYP
jgi:predicted DCC family thiol-disulfide oxidoreductase YuxK